MEHQGSDRLQMFFEPLFLRRKALNPPKNQKENRFSFLDRLIVYQYNNDEIL